MCGGGWYKKERVNGLLIEYSFQEVFKQEESMSRSHHFRGVGQYSEQLMDLAEGKPVFAGRGQKPSNKEVLVVIAAIKRCQRGSFFRAGKPTRARAAGTLELLLGREQGRQKPLLCPRQW